MIRVVLYTFATYLNGGLQNHFSERPEEDEDDGIFSFTGMKEILACEEQEKEMNKKKRRIVSSRRGQELLESSSRGEGKSKKKKKRRR